jgi:hypothetical protein
MMAITRDRLAYAPTLVRRRAREAALAGGAVSLALARSHALARGTPEPVTGDRRPDTFTVTGENAEFRYWAGDSSLMGVPTFTYTWPDGEVSATSGGFEVQPIVTGGWPFGSLISMYVDAAPDAWARSVTLVLPSINLIDGEATDFTTFAVLTTHFTNIGGPAFVEGQLQEYEIILLEGTASAEGVS